jgi:hypothetical protein
LKLSLRWYASQRCVLRFIQVYVLESFAQILANPAVASQSFKGTFCESNSPECTSVFSLLVAAQLHTQAQSGFMTFQIETLPCRCIAVGSLHNMFVLFAYTRAEASIGDFTADGFVSPAQVSLIRDTVRALSQQAWFGLEYVPSQPTLFLLVIPR